MITEPIREEDYVLAGSFTAFWTPGEYGPLDCGCCLVIVEFDPHGPRLCMHLEPRDAAPHEHRAEDFARLLTR